MSATKIYLTNDEMQIIKNNAKEITIQARLHNQKINVIAPEYDVELIGLMGEYAAAQYFNIDFVFNTLYDYERNDLSNGYEVRSTTWPNGNLIIYDDDKPACYILAIVNLDESSVDLKGWLHIIECRQKKYWRDKPQVRQASYWVSQSDLRPLAQLRSDLSGRANV